MPLKLQQYCVEETLSLGNSAAKKVLSILSVKGIMG
jgi:hypothetical protein